MKEGKIFKEWLYNELAGAGVADGRIFRYTAKGEVKGGYILTDSVEVTYDGNKDCHYADGITARIVCVDKSEGGAENLADTIEELLDGAHIATLDGCIEVTARRCDYDAAIDEFLEEIRIKVEL